MAGGVDDGSTYNKKTAFVYIFNLVVGVGALSLPYGFSRAGLVLGTLFLAIIGFLAFITTTWIIEASAAANFILRNEKKEIDEKSSLINELNSEQDDCDKKDSNDEDHIGGVPSSIGSFESEFEIKERIEVGQMSKIYFGPIGYKLFYAALVVYLFGDLSIYAATVPKSLATVSGSFSIGKLHLTSSENGLHGTAYYFFLFLFACFAAPLSLFNFQKTKYLQILTLFTRNFAFFLMIILSIIFVAKGNGSTIKDVKIFDISNLPVMFGVSIYSFMCHHSLPSILTPIRKKNKLPLLMGLDFILIFAAYATLCISSLFAFGNVTNPTCEPMSGNIHTFIPCQIQQLFIYNFTSYNIKFFADFLALFPVFTLSTNYVLISITLRNNLMLLITWKQDSMNPKIRSLIFSLASSLIPVIIAFCTRDVGLLVNITGAYFGICIMFIFPVFISYFSNKMLAEKYNVVNLKKSVFSNKVFYILILLISLCSFVLATYNIVKNYGH
ncbi:hypothetical protein DICPUDRAFT_160120 [Dictyostelium purpureum]|uniref:Amino acid transporter transmembrane domain-containing protein n=1 Tax=Dictyostelium purpureum TaxID=5786 RepID=F1A5R8_DICPU|nr:uncharacterized protein DICPUDRAFT_160120 [Dictyostelium purpureum]EGC28464.1 hypothetical protein DICPUDRAFT_160120 [Dictyostelium purpureum]|eukprot:XP_003295012.1 hypothetical protein DICPUDRAFT_160120 [Dictyostelium purpureum]